MDSDRSAPELLVASLKAYYADVDEGLALTPPWSTRRIMNRRRGPLTWRRRLSLAGAAVCLVGIGGGVLGATVLHGSNVIREHVGSLLLVEDVSAAATPPRISQSQAVSTALGGAPAGYHITAVHYSSGLLSATNDNGIKVSEFGKPVAVWVVELAGSAPELTGVSIIDGATGHQLLSTVVTTVILPTPSLK